jgi:hypothetical protein
MEMMRKRIKVSCAIAAACSLLATTTAAWAISPKAGDYQGCPNGATTTNGHCEGEGYFSVKRGKIKKYANFSGIVAPSTFQCSQLNATLEAKRIKVSGGSFDYRGTAKIGYGPSPTGPFKRMNIRFKGSWKSKSLVKGYTRISGRNSRGPCDTGKIKWKMKTPPPS